MSRLSRLGIGYRRRCFTRFQVNCRDARDGVVYLWQSGSLAPVGTLRGHSGYVTSAAFSPDVQTLATASNDGIVKLWAVESREELMTLPGHIAPWTQVAFSPNGTELAACGEAGLIRVWRAPQVP